MVTSDYYPARKSCYTEVTGSVKTDHLLILLPDPPDNLSLLDAIYKIGSSCIANRIKRVLPSLIDDDQTGSFPTDTRVITFG